MNSEKRKSTHTYDDVGRSKTVSKCYITADEMTDSELDEYIENARREYRNDWWRYTDEDTDEYFIFQPINLII